MLILSLSIYPSTSTHHLLTQTQPQECSCYVYSFYNLDISEGSDHQSAERDSEMGRSPCCEKVGLKKGPWTPEEDQKLLAYIEEHGHGSWRALPTKAGLQRCGKSCRLRWTNYLRPDIKRGKFSLQEEQTIIQLHALLGNRWSAIATHLPKRTDNEIKNYWNTHLKKRLAKMGIDPVTHKPKNETLGCQTKNAANLSHMAQWESARLEAEARLARESKLRQSSTSSTCTKSTPPPPPPPPPPSPPCLDVFKAWQSVSSSTGVDLESPTSTLSFSTTGHPIAPTTTTTIMTQTLCAVNQEVDWKCFGKSTWLNPGTENEYGHGFCGMLLDNSSENLEAQGSCVGEEQENNNINNSNNNYWDSILDLVNSSSPSNSPSVF